MSLKKKAATSLVWTFSQQFGNQLIGFVISIILARILLPEEFGLIGMIAVFIALGNAMVHGGMSKSLIRSDNIDENDYSSVFYFNFLASIIIYLILYLCAPLIADFYERLILIDIIRLYSLTFIISAFALVPLARLTRKMDFKTQSLTAIPAAIVGGGVGIYMATEGFGVWSLVWSHLSTNFTNTALLWILVGWIPRFEFDRIKLKQHLDFGYRLTLSEILDRLFKNIYLIAIGRFFSATQLGFYTRAETMNQLPVQNISRALDKVTFPLFAKIKNDNTRLKDIYKRLMKMVVFIVTPVLLFLAIMAEPVFRFLFTEKWLPAVPYFQILCVTGMILPLHSYNLGILNVKGRSDLFLRLEIIKKVVIVVILLATIPFGIKPLLYGQVFASIIIYFVNSHYTGKFIDYPALEQLKDILPIISLSLISGIMIYFLDVFFIRTLEDFLRIFLGIGTGVIIYLALARALNFNSLSELIKLLKKR
ncbi:lipopolysaccharide biosynthesis protein [Gramella sp. GC03-9]|uniref:Lipopolysaccharide biosynthesis protein n=1 Tax=Christiangramia oceanisediminis TaxID=2920386 RepID=A0A9X2IBI0_9FLAO|nr:lipopolysaccharide biosynthesis protein [Gramella oceanisediminis]MCP9199878.1 lipopolysaccharide biosynthesis protein [Gramella oceanisediminis]